MLPNNFVKVELYRDKVGYSLHLLFIESLFSAFSSVLQGVGIVVLLWNTRAKNYIEQ